jgi:hypothetical protein
MFGPDQFKAAYQHAITDFKTIVRDESPKGKPRQDIENRIKLIEAKLAEADAAFAHTLGFPICHCKLPGVPMLWREAESAHVCSSCGHRKETPRAAKVGMNGRDRHLARRSQSNDDWDIFTGK